MRVRAMKGAAMSCWRSLMLMLIALICLATGVSAAEKEFGTKNWYLPVWDSVCAIGTDVDQGCDAVRARDIVDASKYPWSAIGRINFSGYRTDLHCTGSLVGDRIVVTTSRCLYDRIGKKWLRPEEVVFLAGYQRGTAIAHSKAARFIVSDTHDIQSDQHQYHPADDWAIIELRKPIGVTTGYLGWYKFDGTELEDALQSGGKIALAGYPALRQHVVSVDGNCNGTMSDADHEVIIHGCAGTFGDIGGPILLMENGKVTVAAINSGIGKEDGNVFWTGTPIANFHSEILKALGDDFSLQQVGGRTGLSGKPPIN